MKDKLNKIIILIVALLLFVSMSFLYSQLNDLQTKLVFLPVIFAGDTTSFILACVAFDLTEIQKIVRNAYSYLFVCFYFIIVSMATIETLKTGANLPTKIHMGVFWILGVVLFYSMIIKKNRI